jgi:formate C-acetyltransferase
MELNLKMQGLKNELRKFYSRELHEIFTEYKNKCNKELEEFVPNDINPIVQKGAQYEAIAKMCEPQIFNNCRFYYELGAFEWWSEGIGGTAPGEWTYLKRMHMFRDFNPELFKRREDAPKVQLYSLCGQYGDERQHFAFYSQEILKSGLSGLYECIQSAYNKAESDKEKQLFESMQKGLLALKNISEKFSVEANERLKSVKNKEEYERLKLIAQTAKRVPWEAPESFYEALNTVMFLQMAVAALEGVALETMGRLDKLLYPFYQNDLKKGISTQKEIYDMICEFITVFDSRMDYNEEWSEKQVFDPAYTYTLGGCDENGEPLCNELTLMFLKANYELKAVYPKIKCRINSRSPKEYLDAINRDIIRGRSTVLIQNDETIIPAFTKKGVSLKDARDYAILGCWEPVLPQGNNQHCNYMFLTKILEYSVWENGFNFGSAYIKPIENSKSFEEVYNTTVANIRSVFFERGEVISRGREFWPKVIAYPLLSSSIESCIKSKRDLSDGGTKYKIDNLALSGIPNVVNSLIVIKELCFEKKLYSLKELLNAVRHNWEGFEELRTQALKCHFWGDESKEACSLMARFCNDLSAIVAEMPSPQNGKTALGSMLYMEMPKYSEKLRATPDGRKNYDYFCRGLEPTKLHPIDNFTTILNSFKWIDTTDFAANSVINMTLSFGDMESTEKMAICEAFLRTATKMNIQALQLNAITKEELIDAQMNPDKHSQLVVRVCGFSAKFNSLSKKTQDEFITRNFYKA